MIITNINIKTLKKYVNVIVNDSCIYANSIIYPPLRD